MLADRPLDGLMFFNRGQNGARTSDMYARVKSDVISLGPTILSVLIGVNDTWHDSIGPRTIAKYESIYRSFLSETRDALPSIRMILCEPFLLPCGLVTAEWTRGY